jgi:hypothetical protein
VQRLKHLKNRGLSGQAGPPPFFYDNPDRPESAGPIKVISNQVDGSSWWYFEYRLSRFGKSRENQPTVDVGRHNRYIHLRESTCNAFR